MDGAETARFEHLLLARREALMSVAEMAQQGTDTVTLDQTRVGRLSRMDALQQQAMSQENSRRRALELKRTGQALSRIKEGEYGYCVECGEAIAPNRLQIDPATPLCIECASRGEQKYQP
ncbi:MAG: TraR/DksA family transcriptional regulator [Sedimenticola sp.]|nr:TraR/DksA family transcriptional regulator [Sedimenticola sp.]